MAHRLRQLHNQNPPRSPFFKGGCPGSPPFEKGGLGGFLSAVFSVLLGIFLPLSLGALTIPDRPTGRVQDEARLLTADQRSSLESKLQNFEQETTNQIVVFIYPSLEGESLEDFSIHLAEKWKIGQKGRDNGIILLIFPQDHLVRFEVGYGLESVVPDAYTSRITEEKIKPNFRQGNFNLGINEAVDALMAATRGVYEPASRGKSRNAGSRFNLLFVIFFPLFLLLSLVQSLLHYGWRKTFSSTGTSGRYMGGGWGGGGGSWGGGGGFGGGGGSFGGGGSSGSW